MRSCFTTTPIQRRYNATTTPRDAAEALWMRCLKKTTLLQLLQRFCTTVGKYATLLQRFCNASTALLQRFYNASATLQKPKKDNASTTLLQRSYNASTTLLQRLYKAFTTLLQRFNSQKNNASTTLLRLRRGVAAASQRRCCGVFRRCNLH